MTRLRTWWQGASNRTRMLISGGATVLVLAGVILGVSAFGQSRTTPDQWPETSTERGLADYRKGQDALAAGDTTGAALFFERALAADPGNTQASDALARIEADRASGGEDPADTPPAKDPDPAKPPAVPDSAPFLEPVDDLAVLLPERASGFDLGAPQVVGDDAVVSGTPARPDLAASRALWSVHDRKTKKAAARFVDDVSKVAFADDPASVNIEGIPAYFGTDGTRFATVSFVRGRYAFEVTLTTISGLPAELQDEAVRAAQAFPDSF